MNNMYNFTTNSKSINHVNIYSKGLTDDNSKVIVQPLSRYLELDLFENESKNM